MIKRSPLVMDRILRYIYFEELHNTNSRSGFDMKSGLSTVKKVNKSLSLKIKIFEICFH